MENKVRNKHSATTCSGQPEKSPEDSPLSSIVSSLSSLSHGFEDDEDQHSVQITSTTGKLECDTGSTRSTPADRYCLTDTLKSGKVSDLLILASNKNMEPNDPFNREGGPLMYHGVPHRDMGEVSYGCMTKGFEEKFRQFQILPDSGRLSGQSSGEAYGYFIDGVR
ncbi:hypothetical protein Tco_0590034 [Tanacetum coccineum]